MLMIVGIFAFGVKVLLLLPPVIGGLGPGRT